MDDFDKLVYKNLTRICLNFYNKSKHVLLINMCEVMHNEIAETLKFDIPWDSYSPLTCSFLASELDEIFYFNKGSDYVYKYFYNKIYKDYVDENI